MYVYMYGWMHVCVCVCMYVCMYMRVCMHVCMHVCMRVCIVVDSQKSGAFSLQGHLKKCLTIISLFWELNVDMLNLFRIYLPLPVMNSLSRSTGRSLAG